MPTDGNLDAIKSSGVIHTAFKSTLSGMPGKVLLFLDTCHSGNVMGDRRGVPVDVDEIVNDLVSAENGVVVFTSSTGRQYSLENEGWNNGAFTKALVEGLSGQAKNIQDGSITLSQLDHYLAKRVKELTKGEQTPISVKSKITIDFPIALVK